jgi:site-specific DNA recombinase
MQLDGQTIALYYRVSDKYKQGDNFSIESQQDMKAFCQKAGATVLEFIEMEGASEFSKGLDRTELSKVMELARQKKIHGIMYYIANRFTRDIADGILLRRELYRLGVKLYCYHPFPREITSDMEMLHVFEDYGSQQYVRNLRESTMRGYRQKVEKGLFPKGIPPFGYVVTGKKSETVIRIHNEYGRVVQNIFHWAAYERLSTGDIAKRLTSMSIPTPGELTKRKIKREKIEWSYNTVYQILKDTAYKGVWYAFGWKMEGTKRVKDHSNRVEITIPRIVDDLTWEMVQNRPRYQKQHDHTFLLTGYARCNCGAPIIGTNRISASGLRRYYYKCAGDKVVNGKACQNYYRCDYVDYHVWEFIKKCIYNPDYLLRLLDTDNAPSLAAERITALQEEIKGFQE